MSTALNNSLKLRFHFIDNHYACLAVYIKSSLAYHRPLASSCQLPSTNSVAIAVLKVKYIYIAHNSVVITNAISLQIELELLIFVWMRWRRCSFSLPLRIDPQENHSAGTGDWQDDKLDLTGLSCATRLDWHWKHVFLCGEASALAFQLSIA